VRNPYTRILSAFLNKIKLTNNDLQRRKKILLQLGVDISKESNLNRNITFQEFVECVYSQPLKFMDDHWRIQYYQTFQENLNYDFIGRFENVTEDLNQVLNKIAGKEAKKYIATVNAHKTNASTKIKKFYTEEIRDMVYTKYKKDFDYFNYTSILPEVSNKHANIINDEQLNLLSSQEMKKIKQKMNNPEEKDSFLKKFLNIF
jgi:hypothetical protein